MPLFFDSENGATVDQDGVPQPDNVWEFLLCEEHGLQPIVSADSFTGFAGGTSFVYTLRCGCKALDESGDVEAAR